MLRKPLNLLLVAVLLAALLAGCAENRPAATQAAATLPVLTQPQAAPESSAAPTVQASPAEPGPTKAAPEAVDVESIYEAGMRAVNRRGKQLLLMQETRLDFLEAFFPGISEVKLSQHRFSMSRETNAPLEVDLALVRNEADVQTVIDIFQARVKARSEDASNPEYAAVWENNARVTSRGKLVILAVLPDDYGPIPEEFLLN